MGLSIKLVKECAHCGSHDTAFDGGYTYNVSPMWLEIFGDDAPPQPDHLPKGFPYTGMVHIDNMTGEESIPILDYAIGEMDADMNKFRAMDPLNGWGSADGFREFLGDLRDAASCNRDHVWRTWR